MWRRLFQTWKITTCLKMSNARPVVDSFSGLNRPSSAQLETLQTRQLHTRPLSDQIPVSYKSPEAQGFK